MTKMTKIHWYGYNNTRNAEKIENFVQNTIFKNAFLTLYITQIHYSDENLSTAPWCFICAHLLLL